MGQVSQIRQRSRGDTCESPPTSSEPDAPLLRNYLVILTMVIEHHDLPERRQNFRGGRRMNSQDGDEVEAQPSAVRAAFRWMRRHPIWTTLGGLFLIGVLTGPDSSVPDETEVEKHFKVALNCVNTRRADASDQVILYAPRRGIAGVASAGSKGWNPSTSLEFVQQDSPSHYRFRTSTNGMSPGLMEVDLAAKEIVWDYELISGMNNRVTYSCETMSPADVISVMSP